MVSPKYLFTKHFIYLKWRYWTLYKLYGHGLCKGKPTSKNSFTNLIHKVQKFHFRYLKFLVIFSSRTADHWLPRTTLSIMTFAPVLYDISPRACLGGMIYAVLWSGSILVGVFVATQGVVVFKGVLSNDYLWNGVWKWWWQGWMLKHTDHIDLQKVIFSLKFTTIYNIIYIYVWLYIYDHFVCLNQVPFCIRRGSMYEFHDHMMLRIYIRSETWELRWL